MKRVLWVLLSILLLAGSVYAKSNPYILGAVPVVAAGETEETCTSPCIFSASWTGSDTVNTGAGTGHVFDGTETDPSSYLSMGSSGGGWNGEDGHIVYSGNGGSTAYVQYDFTNTDSIGIRMGAYLASESMNDGNSQEMMVTLDANSAINIECRVGQDSGSPCIEVWLYDSTYTYVLVGRVAISMTTWYQVLIKWTKNTANGCAFEVWSADGGTQIGTTQTLSGKTTFNIAQNLIRVGAPYDRYATESHRLDILKITNTYDFPDKRTY